MADGAASRPSDIREAVLGPRCKAHFRPEFLNRIDETVVFHALDLKNIENDRRASSSS